MKDLSLQIDAVIDNQKAIAAALEWLIRRESWGLNMSEESYDMINTLRAVNDRPPFKWRT